MKVLHTGFAVHGQPVFIESTGDAEKDEAILKRFREITEKSAADKQAKVDRCEGEIRLPGKWQPIETAPTSGLDVLVWDGDVTVARYSEKTINGPGWEVTHSDNMYETATVRPTHWMHLPEGPEE